MYTVWCTKIAGVLHTRALYLTPTQNLSHTPLSRRSNTQTAASDYGHLRNHTTSISFTNDSRNTFTSISANIGKYHVVYTCARMRVFVCVCACVSRSFELGILGLFTKHLDLTSPVASALRFKHLDCWNKHKQHQNRTIKKKSWKTYFPRSSPHNTTIVGLVRSVSFSSMEQAAGGVERLPPQFRLVTTRIHVIMWWYTDVLCMIICVNVPYLCIL